ncbi:MAG: DSD1 family PLP-dependent enzyme [Hyphomicrobiaceae bacterium]
MLWPDSAALRELPTPSLVVDGTALDANIRAMADTARSAGVMLRPHAKTHKTREIAELQLEAGAAGICCATVTEAEALSAAGVRSILVTSPTFGADRFASLARINRDHGLKVVVDHPAQVDGLTAVMQPSDRALGVLVDLDVGQHRTGVADNPSGVALAKMIAAHPMLVFAGIQGYAGHAQHIEDPDERCAAIEASAAKVRSLVEALGGEGLAPPLVTGAGTGSYRQDARGPFNELQVGSYVFMDADYGRILDAEGSPPPFEASLFVLSTVVSANQPGEITVDAGTKVLATNGPPPAVLIGVPPGSAYRFGGDEHGMITVPAGQPVPPLGARILIGATHCDPTVNLHPAMHVVRGNRTERWPVLGRHSA